VVIKIAKERKRTAPVSEVMIPLQCVDCRARRHCTRPRALRLATRLGYNVVEFTQLNEMRCKIDS
jgi:hypothetical protein